MIRPKVPAYDGTSVPAERTYAQIQKLLLDAGCEAVQITHEASGRAIIRFALEVEVNGVRRQLGVEIIPPLFSRRTIQGRRRVVTDDPNRSARLAYWYLKTKIEAIQYGLVSAEREFLAQVMVQLPDGRTGTVGDATDESIGKGTGFFLPGLQERRFVLPPGEGGA